jgi:uncharacterized protein YmfQ (DUF2313 family)
MSDLQITFSNTPEVVALCGLTPDDWLTTLLDLLPTGPIWPRERTTTLARFWLAIADAMVAVHKRDCALLAESFPCGSTELLPDWERVVGLPDECLPDVSGYPLPMRRAYVCQRLATVGDASRGYFIALAASFGFDISITEHPAWELGCSLLCPPTAVGTVGHWWTVGIANNPIKYITVGCWNLGDALYTAEGMDLLQCLIRRDAPAHTIVTFAFYSEFDAAYWNTPRWNFTAWSPQARLQGEAA